jgi:hypothetical protein
MPFPEYRSDTALPPDNDILLLTSRNEMIRLVSNTGMELHSDDLNILSNNYDEFNPEEVNSENFLIEIIQRVSSEIMSYLKPRYNLADVYNLPRIREIATYWAVYKLTGRRGNEPLYKSEYIEGIDTLEKYRSGELYLDAPSYGPRAYMVSYVVDNRYNTQPVRAINQASSNLYPGQKQYYYWGFQWL